jgi:hypothetical protein
MHPDVFHHPNPYVREVNELAHEVGAAELHRIFGIHPDDIPRVTDAPLGAGVRGQYLTHVVDTLLPEPD